MILKIKKKEDSSWRIVDNVKDVEYEYMSEKEAKKLRDDTVETKIWWLNNYGNLPNKRIAMMEVRYKDGDREYIFTDDTIYILNEEGKTCDSIGVYN